MREASNLVSPLKSALSPKERKTDTTCSQMLPAALLTAATWWKQHRCPSTEDAQYVVHPHSGIFLGHDSDEGAHAIASGNLEDSVLSDRSQSQVLHAG